MKKIVLSTLVLSSFLFATDVKPYVGLNLGFGSNEVEISGVETGNSFSGSDRSTELSYGISGGAVINDTHRVSLSYNYLDAEYDFFNEKSSADFHLFLANYDYLFELDYELKPYIGVHAGYMDFDADGGDEISGEIAYGVNLGIIKDITQNISFEVGYKYTYFDINHRYTYGLDYDELEIPDSHYLGFGINFSF